MRAARRRRRKSAKLSGRVYALKHPRPPFYPSPDATPTAWRGGPSLLPLIPSTPPPPAPPPTISLLPVASSIHHSRHRTPPAATCTAAKSVPLATATVRPSPPHGHPSRPKVPTDAPCFRTQPPPPFAPRSSTIPVFLPRRHAYFPGACAAPLFYRLLNIYIHM